MGSDDAIQLLIEAEAEAEADGESPIFRLIRGRGPATSVYTLDQ
jgi:hypothetical protein